MSAKKQQRRKGREQAAAVPGKPSGWPPLRSITTVCALLVLALMVYGGAARNGLLNWDDNFYITENPHLRDLSWNGLRNIFGAYLVGNYHPLTLLSYALEYAFAGRVDPALMHTTNIVLHAINGVLVFLLGKRLLNDHWGGVLVALLFALHPMHVESVAWIAERKDLLYTFFLLLSLLCYMRFMRERRGGMYALSLLLFTCSLLSKSAAAAMAPLLFVIDQLQGRSVTLRSALEKLPFFGLAVIFGIVALSSQSVAMEESFAPHFSWSQRPLIALYALAFYTVRFFVPYGQSAMHPYPLDPGDPIAPLVGPAIGVALVMGGALLLAWRNRAYWPLVCGGLLFYVITLAMVLQLFPVGRAIVAERYTYVPYIGLSLIVVKLSLDLWRGAKGTSHRIALLPALLLVAALPVHAGLTIHRIAVWKDSYSLFTDILGRYPDDDLTYYNRGLTSFHDGDMKGAIKDYDACVLHRPDRASCYFNRGLAYKELGNMDAVIRDMGLALEHGPGNANAYRNRGNAKAMAQDYEGSIADFTRALHYTPGDTDLLVNRGLSHFLSRSVEQACADWDRASNAGSRKGANLLRDQCMTRPALP
ncbi:MAG: glycosyltransferase family 39 protein [Flavobacteriales bacterium]|nr:glycosyltransferase family 39 protein [Flavobacteriales bacterium]